MIRNRQKIADIAIFFSTYYIPNNKFDDPSVQQLNRDNDSCSKVHPTPNTRTSPTCLYFVCQPEYCRESVRAFRSAIGRHSCVRQCVRRNMRLLMMRGWQSIDADDCVVGAHSLLTAPDLLSWRRRLGRARSGWLRTTHRHRHAARNAWQRWGGTISENDWWLLRRLTCYVYIVLVDVL